MNNASIQKHTLLHSIILHLLPGFLISGFYFLIRQPMENLGYPSIFCLGLAIAFILIPFELGYLLYQGKKMTGRLTLSGVISYRTPIPWWQYLVWVGGVFALIGLISNVLKPVEVFLHANVFAWMPTMDFGLDGTYSKSALLVTYGSMFVLNIFAGPLVEELYFRGYLLPRIPGKYAIITESFLFALYHVFTPWMIVFRTIGFLPMIYATQKKNIYVGMLIHMLCNSLDVITGFVFIASM